MKQQMYRWIGALLVVAIGIAATVFIRLRQPRPAELAWETGSAVTLPPVTYGSPDQPALIELRDTYGVDEIIAGSPDDLTRLVRLTAWTNRQWKHNGSAQPSKPDPLTILAEVKAGSNFRCVEYAAVLKGLSTAEGMPARSLGLKRRDTATAISGAGHVVAEVWLPDLQKWVFADGQFGYVPVSDGRPLNAVELQQAIVDGDSKLTFISADGPVSDQKRSSYIRWVAPYLYYFDYQFDQRQYDRENTGSLMLVPKGAPNLTVFQRKTPLTGFVYISDPSLFYRAPGTPTDAKH